jgi:hypothetical protein
MASPMPDRLARSRAISSAGMVISSPAAVPRSQRCTTRSAEMNRSIISENVVVPSIGLS